MSEQPKIYHAPGRGYFYVSAGRIVWIANGWLFFYRKRPPQRRARRDDAND